MTESTERSASSPVGEQGVSGSSAPLLARVLGGQVRLPFAFWVLGVAGNLLVWTLTSIASELYPGNPTVGAASLLSLIYFIFSLVATWRSASKYSGDRIWAVLSKVIVSLVIVIYVMMLFIAMVVVSTRGH